MIFFRRVRDAWGDVARSDAFYVGLLGAVTLLLYAPLLFQNALIAGDERLDGYYQYGVFLGDALRSGESLLWNPHSYLGFPSYLNQFGAFLFTPVQAAFYLFDPFTAFHVVIALATFAGLVSAYFFARSLFLTPLGAYVVAQSYLVAQVPDTMHLGLSYAHSFLVFPLLLLCLVRVKKSTAPASRIFWILAATAAVATGLIAGYFVTLVYALVIAGIFALFIDRYGTELDLSKGIHASLALGIAVGIGILVSLPQLVGLYEYKEFTSRTAEFAQQAAVGSGVELADAARLFLPHHFPLYIDNGRGYFYFGVIPLFCILLAISLRTRITWFFAALYVGIVWFAANGLIAEWINVHVPPFSRIGGVSRWLLPGALIAAYLAGYGFDQLRKGGLAHKRLLTSYVLVVLGGLGALVALPLAIGRLAESAEMQLRLLKWYLYAQSRPIESLSLPLEHYLAFVEKELHAALTIYSPDNPHYVIFIATALLSVFALLLYMRQRGNASHFLIVIALSLSTLAAFRGGLGDTVSRDFYVREVPQTVATMRDIDPAAQYRYFTLYGNALGREAAAYRASAEERVAIMRDLLYRESGVVFGLRNAGGFEPIRPKRHNLIIDGALAPFADTVIDPHAIRSGAELYTYGNTTITKKATPEEKVADVISRLPLLSMMNVRFIISLYPLADSRLRVLPLDDPGPIVDVYMYENLSVLPRVYFAEAPELWRGSERELVLAMLETPDFSRRTIIECAECTGSPSGGELRGFDEGNGYLEAVVTSGSGGWLVFSESHLPGWIAEVDGKRTPIRTANYLFQAVFVPAGTHQVTFCYPGSFRLLIESVGMYGVSCAAY